MSIVMTTPREYYDIKASCPKRIADAHPTIIIVLQRLRPGMRRPRTSDVRWQPWGSMPRATPVAFLRHIPPAS